MERINVQRKILDKDFSFNYLIAQEHGLFLSGGLDSLSLLNWFSVDAPELLNNLTLFTIRKESVTSSERIAKHYSLKKHIFVERNNKQGEAAKAVRLQNPQIRIFYAGLTENPKVKLNFIGPEAVRSERPSDKIQLPFVDVDKRYPVQLALNLNAPIKLSHTCTAFENIHCGRCFMCAERIWAFKELHATDPATYQGV